MKREKVFKPLAVRLSAFEDSADRKTLEDLYEAHTLARAQANEATRQAALADAEAGIAVQQSRMAFIRLLLEAGKSCEAIRGETTWTVYRKDGELVFECPFTEVDMRNAMRVQRANVDQAARSIGGAESLYEGDEDDEKTIGFNRSR